MLRRSVPFRRMLAVALAGVALGACSNATKDATEPSTQGNLGPTSPLSFSLSSDAVSFTYGDGVFSPASRTVDVSGTIVTSVPWVKVGAIDYDPSNVKNWLTVTQRATVLPDKTLGVRLTFTPRFVAGVDLGGAKAAVPVTVPGSNNGPQIITVSTGEVFGCAIKGNLAFPSNNNLIGNLQPGTTCQADVLAGERVFDAYTLTVPANATFTLLMRARPSDPSCGTYPCPGTTVGNLYDPYLFLVDSDLYNGDPATSVVRADDDCGRGFNGSLYDSRVVWTNPTSAPKKYYVLASQYSTNQFGTYTVDVYDGTFYPSYPNNPSFCSGYSPTSASFSIMAPNAEQMKELVIKKYGRANPQQ